MISTLLLLAISPSFAGDAPLTREMLLADCPIPQHREFPTGPITEACEDFHAYACRGVESSFQLPADRSAWTFTLHDSAERLLYAKKKYFSYLKKGYTPTSPRAAQLKDFYLACLNKGDQKREEVELVKKEKELLASITTKEGLFALLSARNSTPDFTFVTYTDSPNQKDPTAHDVPIYATDITYPEKTYYDNPENIADLRNLALHFFQAIDMDQPETRANWIVDHEMAYAKVSPTPEELRKRNTEDNYRSREDFLQKYPNLKLSTIFSLLPKNILLRDFQPELLTFLNDTLKNEPLEKLKSVMLYQQLRNSMDEAYPEFFKLQFQFNNVRLGGPKQRAPVEERCTKLVMSNFGMELDEELLPILFPNFPTKRVIESANKIRKAIVAGLKANTWLSETARTEAIKKISSAEVQLVKPTNEKDWHFLPIAKYDQHSPIANLKKIGQAVIDRLLSELNEKRNRSRWNMTPLKVNASYNPPDNKFTLPQAILQPPLFDENASDESNIAAIGSIVGHELGHSIDDQGNHYDSSGVIRDWMTEKDHQNFAERSKGFIDLYDSYGHNGKLTLGENIGDHVGLTFSFAAAYDGKEPSAEQVRNFYLSYGRTWCTVMRPEYEKMLLKTDPHSMGWARINGQVIQQEAFIKAFSCKPGQKMFLDKEKRVRIW